MNNLFKKQGLLVFLLILLLTIAGPGISNSIDDMDTDTTVNSASSTAGITETTNAAKTSGTKDSSSELISFVEYEVKSGDCLWAIAQKTLNNCDLWSQLASFNNLMNPSLIFPGQIIQIPIEWFNSSVDNINSDLNSGSTTSGTVTDNTQVTPVPTVTPGVTPPADTGNEDWGNAPTQYKINFSSSEVTAGTQQYQGWVDSALSATDTSKCPEPLTDKYGNNIDKDLIVKAITLIESSGNHTKSGEVIENSWGFTGFMQLSTGFGEGRFDPATNIQLGTNYLFKSCLKSATTPGNSDYTYNANDSAVERLVKAAVGYNRGPYATSKNISSKLTSGELALENSWQDVVANASTQNTYMTEGVHYGIKFKACLGLELTSTERDWIKRYKGYSDTELDSWCDKNYSYTRNM